MDNLSVAEVVEKLQSAKSKAERIQILKSNDSQALRGILRMNFDKELKLDLPEGEPPYKKLVTPKGFGNTTLKASSKGWYVFVKSLSPDLTRSKRERLFISLLESLDQKEASILVKAKDRKLDLGLTRKVIDEVFPGLIKATDGTKNVSKKESTKNTTTTTSTT